MPAIRSTTPVHPLDSTSPSAPAANGLVRATLFVAGGVAVAIGAAITFAPRRFIDIEGTPTPDLLSETRAPGAMLLVIGVFVLIAGIRRRQVHAAATMSALTYLGYGLARTASMIVDGPPTGPIVAATIVELTLGVASLAAAKVTASSVESPSGRIAR